MNIPRVRRLGLGVLTALSLSVLKSSAAAPSPAGLWDATVVVNGIEIPFRFELTGEGPAVKGSFFDGDLRVPSTRGRFENRALLLEFDQYASKLDATWKDDRLEGQYDRGARGVYPFKARRASTAPVPVGKVPSIAGQWKIAINSPKGESAWRFIVRQSGPQVSAAILRVDGDTGTLSGTYRDGKFVLSHFSGVRPALLEVTPAPDGTLDILQNGQTRLVAVRTEDPRSKDVPEPTDPTLHTRVTDPHVRFQFSFPDLDGRIVANTDPRFHGKVVFVSITGSWCPNCHDEAPFLAELYRRYRQKGLEIVAFSFEEPDQLKNPTRLRAFIKQYGIEYTVLLAGQPEQLAEKVPQAVNLNAFPTTFVLGRDGRVRSVHAGFASPASGSFHAQGKNEVTAQVERLLADRPPT